MRRLPTRNHNVCSRGLQLDAYSSVGHLSVSAESGKFILRRKSSRSSEAKSCQRKGLAWDE